MQMYVNYYTLELMNEGDNPTIGTVLCAVKSNVVVKYTLSENDTQIFASKYMTYIPSEEEFKRELRLDDYKRKNILQNKISPSASYRRTITQHIWYIALNMYQIARATS